MYEESANQSCSDAVASAQQNAENENFRNSTRFAEDTPVPVSNSTASGQATPTVVRETIYREVVQSEAVVTTAASGMDPNPPVVVVEREEERCSRISEAFAPRDRNVRRRMSHSPAISRAQSSFDSPTRAALREQVARQGETVGHLQGQL